MKFEISEKFEKFRTSPSFRRNVVRELEKSGTIVPLNRKEFGSIVYGKDFK